MYSKLPPACRAGDQAQLWKGITEQHDLTIAAWRSQLANYRAEWLDPAQIRADLLDWRAGFTPWRSLWSEDWAEATKRDLLINTAEIFRDRYSPRLLPKLFGWFRLPVRLEPTSGWILGVTALSATPGTSIEEYRVIAPLNYAAGTAARAQLDWVIQNFGLPIQIQVVLQ